ncbi:MAG: DNA-binding response regulator [Neobacillus sp.]|nr:DNA-binding response regulator [Neobacillus sp.]
MRAVDLCKVLIVDDEILIRQGIKHYINWEQEGFQIVGEASNGQEALDLIEETNPHIIMTDIVMPIMDGEELTRIVKERYPLIEVIILSSFGEFDYVRSAFQRGVVDYILKPKLDAQGMLKVLKTAANRIPSFQGKDKLGSMDFTIEQIINKLISGYEVLYEPELLATTFPYDHYILLGADVKNHPLGETANLSTYLKGKMEKVFKVHQINHHSIPLNQNINIIGCMININKNDTAKVIEFASLIAESEPKWGFAVSEEFVDFSQLGTHYNSLINLLQYRFYFPNHPILRNQHLPVQSSTYEKFNLDWFTDEFKRKNFHSAFQYLDSHVLTLSTCYTTDVFEFKAFLGNLNFNITILLGNMGYDVKELEIAKYSYFKSIDEAHTAPKAIEQFNRFIEEAKRCIVAMEKQPEDLNMKKLLKYIKDHYAEPLTLSDVAKQFHFNASYLSSYFTTHNKEGFIEYLNKVRIEEATKLLINNIASISEISSMVGYSDHSYFCKVFKKIEGMSPSKYKRKQNMR